MPGQEEGNGVNGGTPCAKRRRRGVRVTCTEAASPPAMHAANVADPRADAVKAIALAMRTAAGIEAKTKFNLDEFVDALQVCHSASQSVGARLDGAIAALERAIAKAFRLGYNGDVHDTGGKVRSQRWCYSTCFMNSMFLVVPPCVCIY